MLLSTRLASKVEVPGIPKQSKGRIPTKRLTKDWSGKILVFVLAFLTIVSSITRISSIDEIYQTIPLKRKKKLKF